jgi:hypothetical protein
MGSSLAATLSAREDGIHDQSQAIVTPRQSTKRLAKIKEIAPGERLDHSNS